jgi:hypothetical protein
VCVVHHPLPALPLLLTARWHPLHSSCNQAIKQAFDAPLIHSSGASKQPVNCCATATNLLLSLSLSLSLNCREFMFRAFASTTTYDDTSNRIITICTLSHRSVWRKRQPPAQAISIVVAVGCDCWLGWLLENRREHCCNTTDTHMLPSRSSCIRSHHIQQILENAQQDDLSFLQQNSTASIDSVVNGCYVRYQSCRCCGVGIGGVARGCTGH